MIGPGVVVADGEDVGFDEPLRPFAHRLPSGLTLVRRPEPGLGAEWEAEGMAFGGSSERGILAD